MSEKLKIKPYARLITMLGDQLIKNELIALVELIKNSYDADSDWVKVSFINFDENFFITKDSCIRIEDEGCGMNTQILKKHWLNPATPDKLNRKRKQNDGEKIGRRILQGEKGIGRFAVFKLGRNVTIKTRRQLQNDEGAFIDEGEQFENVLTYNFSKYDDDFLTEGGKEKELYLDNLEVELEEREPREIVDKDISFGARKKRRKPYGTIIEISDLKANWSVKKVEKIQEDIGKLQPIFSKDELDDFSIWIYKDEVLYESSAKYKKELIKLLNNKSVFKITQGSYKPDGNIIQFNINGQQLKFSFHDSELNGLKIFRDYFNKNPNYKTECGRFEFEFYVFDFNSTLDDQTKYTLDKNEKEMIKRHRIYLYRDGIRVMPYGDPEDDWLRIDVTRGTESASSFLSNDQVVGYVNISQKENPKLKDKTNREGLIEDGQALSDFIAILQIVLRYIRKSPYAKYLINKKNKQELDRIKKGEPQELIKNAKDKYENNVEINRFLNTFEKSYSNEKRVLEERIRKTENLAAVGLSIETASHDIMLLMNRTLKQQDDLISDVSSGVALDEDYLINQLTVVRGSLSMIEAQLKNIQLLFPSTKNRTKNIRVKEIVEKVFYFYKKSFNEKSIVCSIETKGSPLVVKTTDAVLLQVFINLFDNAFYWLQTINGEKKIKIILDGDEQRVIFSDNGPGINADDLNYIFEAFFSGKGENGRGLGLYIAKQLLDRYDYRIELAEFKKDKVLPGANFVLEFAREE
ncbi:ATP-binding protein [Ohessyouella blattaphilus]|uniref:histidine kinase n=2 Tax=Bacteria TaxID=2 RepID=A0ABT1EL78_9FIRM|nr:sensor histidine kinase [Ohessyouella blattaphilus]MCP1111460.1 ATP-binding protein [Ohessyouella blattaphilus]MCR8564854.1 ATP-binding protein [Ohessyouella blattaphilus]